MSVKSTFGSVDTYSRRSAHAHIIPPEGPLSPLQTVISGAQHVVAMFGATVLGPLLMGFDPNVAILFSGVATLIFYVIVQGKIPSYLGSSFSFISAVALATAYTAGRGLNPNIPVALGGIIAAGAIYAAIGFAVILVGYRWIGAVMPPVVTGTIVAIIGLNLAPIAVADMNKGWFDAAIGLSTILLVCLATIYAPSFSRRLPILLGGGVAYLLYLIANALGYGSPIDFSGVLNAPWFGVPYFSHPVFDLRAITIIAPVAIVLVAENLGHVKAVGVMTGRNLDPYLGRAFLADGVATMVAGFGGGTGVTTYAENIGVMAVTRNYYSMTFVVAAIFAIGIGLSPKFGAAIHTIPLPIIGGLSFIVFGLITATAGRIWTDKGDPVDFADTRNLLTVGVSLAIGAGNLTFAYQGVAFGGIATATAAALIIYHSLRWGRS